MGLLRPGMFWCLVGFFGVRLRGREGTDIGGDGLSHFVISWEERELRERGWLRRHGTRIYYELKINTLFFSHKAYPLDEGGLGGGSISVGETNYPGSIVCDLKFHRIIPRGFCVVYRLPRRLALYLDRPSVHFSSWLLFRQCLFLVFSCLPAEKQLRLSCHTY